LIKIYSNFLDLGLNGRLVTIEGGFQRLSNSPFERGIQKLIVHSQKNSRRSVSIGGWLENSYRRSGGRSRPTSRGFRSLRNPLNFFGSNSILPENRHVAVCVRVSSDGRRCSKSSFPPKHRFILLIINNYQSLFLPIDSEDMLGFL
jgi:hypothetical protein